MKDQIEITITSEENGIIKCDIIHIECETSYDKQFNSTDDIQTWADKNNYEIKEVFDFGHPNFK